MTPERFQQVGQIYQQAVELEALQRSQFLVEACAGDGELRAEVEARENRRHQARRRCEILRAALAGRDPPPGTPAIGEP